MIKQNFFDELDKDYNEVLADTYKINARNISICHETKEKEHYIVFKSNSDTSLVEDNIIDDIITDCIFSYINDYNKLSITQSNVFNDTLYLSIDSSYITNMYKSDDEINYFSQPILDKADIAYISLNKNQYEITLFPLIHDTYIIRNYIGNDPVMKLNVLPIKYDVHNDTLKVDNTKCNIVLDTKFFEAILDKIKYIHNSKMYEHFKTFIDKIEEKTDLFV